VLAFFSSLPQNFFDGLAIGSVYALFALGYTLIFSILRIVNFAHGAIFTVGAYLTYMLMGGQFGGGTFPFSNDRLPFGMNFWLALVVGGVLSGLINVAIERFAFRPLRNRGSDTLLSLVSSLGVALMVSNIIQNLVGTDPLSSPVPIESAKASYDRFGLNFQTTRLLTFAVAIVVMVGLWFLLNQTKTGKALKAVSEDATTSSLLGISSSRLILLTFFICGFLGAVAGTMVSTNYGTSGPFMGSEYALIGLAVIVIGGLGDIPGAVLGGFLLGILQTVFASVNVYIKFWDWQFKGSDWKDAVPFIALAVVLVFRPQGLLGRAQIQKV
jgi:branched-chain amino acid transport system permease protein